MAQRDLTAKLAAVNAGIITLNGTAAVASDWIDTLGADSVVLVPAIGAISDAGAAAGFGFVVEESDTTADADATEVAANDLVGAVDDLTVTDDAADNTIPGTIGYVGMKRYVRLKATGTTGSAGAVTVIGLLSNLSRDADAGVRDSVAAT